MCNYVILIVDVFLYCCAQINCHGSFESHSCYHGYRSNGYGGRCCFPTGNNPPHNAEQLRTHNLAVQCDSDVKRYAETHMVVPKDKYSISFHPRIEHKWTCAISARSRNAAVVKSGKFIMWQDHMPFQPTPIFEPMCNNTMCSWFIDAKGLSLIRRPGTEPYSMYDWPA